MEGGVRMSSMIRLARTPHEIRSVYRVGDSFDNISWFPALDNGTDLLCFNGYVALARQKSNINKMMQVLQVKYLLV
jgi:hypothetical protein